MKVLFQISKKQGTNQVEYPDDKAFFKDTVVIGNNIIADYSGSLPLTEYSEPVEKTVYTKVEFLDLIPRIIRQQIKAEELAGTLEVLDWIFIVNAMVEVDLNDLPDGFVEGLDAMAINEKISLNQNQIDNFLER
jgi:hypothetical protein